MDYPRIRPHWVSRYREWHRHWSLAEWVEGRLWDSPPLPHVAEGLRGIHLLAALVRHPVLEKGEETLLI